MGKTHRRETMTPAGRHLKEEPVVDAENKLRNRSPVGNPARNILVFCCVILALFAGVSAWLAWWQTEARKKAFALHRHEARDQARACLVLEKDSDPAANALRGAIQDCLFLGPEGQDLEVIQATLRHGLFVLTTTDLFIPGRLSIALTRVYRPGDRRTRAFGFSSDLVYNVLLVGDRWPYTYIDLCLQDGARIHYDRTSPGIGYGDAIYERPSAGSAYQASRIRWIGNGWELSRGDGWQYFFPDGSRAARPSQAALVSLHGPGGIALIMTRDASGDLRRIESPEGNWIQLEYEDHKIVRATDSLGRSVRYEYDNRDRLTKITGPEGVTEYFYNRSDDLVTVTRNGGAPSLWNEFDSEGKLISLTLADGATYQFRYEEDGRTKVRTEVTSPRGETAVVNFNTEGYTVTSWLPPKHAAHSDESKRRSAGQLLRPK